MANLQKEEGTNQVLLDVSIDLLNSIKLSKESKKIFYLEQLKEILLHRSPQLIFSLLDDLFNNLSTEKSLHIKKITLNLFQELFLLHPNFLIVRYLSLCSFYMNDLNDSFLSLLINNVSKVYTKIISTIVSISSSSFKASSSFSDKSEIEPKDIWLTFRQLIMKFNEYISSMRTDIVKVATLSLIQEQVIFTIPETPTSNTATNDPRLNRKDPRLRKDIASSTSSSSTASTASIDLIPIHHPFISKIELQRESEDFIAKATVWCSRGMTNNITFTPNFLNNLGQTIANIGMLRPSYGPKAAGCLTALILSKHNNFIKNLKKNEIENLIKLSTRLCRVTIASGSDPDGHMQKLSNSIQNLEQSMIQSTLELKDSENETQITKDEIQEEAEDIEDVTSESYRGKVLEALDQAQLTHLEKLANATTATENLFHFTRSHTGTDVKYSIKNQSDYTDLYDDIVILSNLNIEFPSKLAQISTSSTTKEINSGVLPVDNGSFFGDIAVYSLLKLMDNYLVAKEGANESFKSYGEVLLRTVMTLSVYNASSDYLVPIISAFGKDVNNNLKEDVPSTVNIPRALWLFVSFCLQPSIIPDFLQHTLAPDYVEDLSFKITLLSNLSNKLLEYVEEDEYYEQMEYKYANNSNHEELKEEDELGVVKKKKKLSNSREIYNSFVLAVISRLIHSPNLRDFSKDYLDSLREIPTCCSSLIMMLFLSGNKSLVAPSNPSLHSTGGRVAKSIRGDCLDLLGRLIFTTDEKTGARVLKFLLWISLNDDYELRTHVIGLLKSQDIHLDDWCFNQVAMFSVHAVCASIGIDSIIIPYMQPLSITDQEIDLINNDTTIIGDGLVFGEGKFSLESLLKHYDGGKCFDGNFDEYFDNEKKQENLKISLQLLTQLTSIEVRLLVVLIQIYCSYQGYILEDSTRDISLLTLINKGAKEITPALSVSKKTTGVWEIISEVKDVRSRPLFFSILEALHPDVYTQAKSELVNMVIDYLDLEELKPIKTEEEINEDKSNLTTSEVSESKNENHMEIDDLGTSNPDPKVLNLICKIKNEDDFKLFLPIITGLTTEAVEFMIPRILLIYGEDLENLKSIILKIVKGRPPRILKFNFLVLLHRLKIEDYDIKSKVIIDTLGLCINLKSDFTGETFRDCFQILLKDDEAPFALMRTAILTSQLYPIVRSYVFNEMVPILINKKVWKTSPKVWDGVIIAIKTLIGSISLGSKYLENTLKILVSNTNISTSIINGKRLQSILNIIPILKPHTARFIQGLSEEDRNELFEGNYLYEKNELIVAENAEKKLDEDKIKILKDLIQIQPASMLASLLNKK